MAHLLHETRKGVDGCTKTSEPSEGSIKLSKMRAIGLQEDMTNLLMLSFKLQTLSPGLCLKQGRGKQLNNKKYNHQKILEGLLPQFKRAE